MSRLQSRIARQHESLCALLLTIVSPENASDLLVYFRVSGVRCPMPFWNSFDRAERWSSSAVVGQILCREIVHGGG